RAVVEDRATRGGPQHEVAIVGGSRLDEIADRSQRAATAQHHLRKESAAIVAVEHGGQQVGIVALVDVAPSPRLSGPIAEVSKVAVHEIDVRPPSHDLHLLLDGVRRKEIVAVEEMDELAPGLANAAVVGAPAPVVRLPDVPDAIAE